MAKRLSPGAVVALKEALCAIYWYKGDLRSFLEHCLSSPALLATLNWTNYKRQVVSDLVDHLTRNQHKHLGDLTRLCEEACRLTSFRHLEQLEGGAQKAARARAAVDDLKRMLGGHEEIKREQDELRDRHLQAEQKLQANAAVKAKLGQIRSHYMSLVMSEDVHDRGFELERVMYDLFELFDLDPKASFRNTGEQLDGAFYLDGTDYLFEAKWHKDPVNASALDTFASKVKRKLENTLGVFLSINGFSPEGVAVHSSGGTVIILMDGADLMAVLDERIDFVSLLLRKKRHASQTGNIYLQFHEIG